MEEVEEAEEVAFIDDFYLTSGSKHPSLMEVPFAIQKIPWEKSELGKIYVQGNCNGAYKVSVEIDMWRLELPLEGKPKFLVRQVTGAWLAHYSSYAQISCKIFVSLRFALPTTS